MIAGKLRRDIRAVLAAGWQSNLQRRRSAGTVQTFTAIKHAIIYSLSIFAAKLPAPPSRLEDWI